MNNLRDLYLHKLEMAYDIESKLIIALERMSAQASDASLKDALAMHLSETIIHCEKIGDLLAVQSVTPTMDLHFFTEMIVHTEEMLAETQTRVAIDTLIIASAQSIEHLEIALYGTLSEWASELGLDDDKKILSGILKEEEAADKKLDGIATGGWFKESINKAAA